MSEFILIFLLVLANGFFAGAEIAVVTVRKGRVEELAAEGRGGARAVLALRDEPERFLATVQVGITVVSSTAAAFGGASLADRLAPFLSRFGWIGEHAESLALGIVVALVSYLSIVLGELVPKSLALRSAERYALLIGTPLLALSWLARPVVWMLSSSANLLLRPFGDRTTFTETRHSVGELQQLVEEGMQAGTIHPEAGEIATRALDLPDLTVADVMVPRHGVAMISRQATPDEIRRILLKQTHTRMPVYDEQIDNVVGYLSVKDLLAVVWDQKPIVLEDVLRPAYFVPGSKRAVELLKELRTRRTPFAVVVNEHGGMSGIITMEDLLEELVGEIFSEHASVTPDVIPEPDGSVIASGSAAVRALNRALELDLPDDGPWTTIAGLCLALAGRMPEAGESFQTPNGTTLEVLDASARRIRSIRVRPPIAPAAVDPAEKKASVRPDES